MSMNLSLYCPVSKTYYRDLFQTSTNTTYKLLGGELKTEADVLADYGTWLRSWHNETEVVERHLHDVQSWRERYPDACFCAT